MQGKIARIFRGDRWVWLIVLGLSLIGIAAVYSSSVTLAINQHNGNTEFYFLRHTIYILIGLVVMYIFSITNYKYFSRLAQIFLWIAIPLLIVTLFIGNNINGAMRAIPILGITFQTSDFAKLAIIMYIARYLSKNQEEIDSFKVFRNILIVISVVVLLIMPENLSTSLVLFATCCLLLFIGRINFKYLFSLFAIGLACAILFVTVMLNIDTEKIRWKRLPTWKKRVEAFVGKDADGSYQSDQALIAVAGGGFFGKGAGHSTQRMYLPHGYSDFIYAIIVEEYGLLGGLAMIFAFLALLYRCMRIVVGSPRAFGALLSLGLGILMTFQAFVHMAVSVGLFPVTGLTIPLVSMGGTSIIFNSIAFGIILSVSRTIQEEKEKLEGGK